MLEVGIQMRCSTCQESAGLCMAFLDSATGGKSWQLQCRTCTVKEGPDCPFPIKELDLDKLALALKVMIHQFLPLLIAESQVPNVT